ncbi:MAG: glycosyltransferase family 2 protein, partial [Gammaproteobacteria bacterium]
LMHLQRTVAPGWLHANFTMARLTREMVRLGGEQHDTELLRGDFFPAATHGDLFSLNGLFVRREAIARAGRFNERIDYYEDWEFTIRVCLQGRGAALDYEGFQRDVGRPDELSYGRELVEMVQMHLYILHTLPRRFPDCTVKYADCLRNALLDAQYQMGKVLTNGQRRRWGRRYLMRCIRRGHKVSKSLVLLVLSLLPETRTTSMHEYAHKTLDCDSNPVFQERVPHD